MRSERGEPPARLIVLGNPRSKRVVGILEAASRLDGIEPVVVSYVDYLTGANVPEVTGSDVIRIESPSENDEIERLILKAGIGPMESLGRVPVQSDEVDSKPFARGEIHHPWQWYLGFQQILNRLEVHWGSVSPRWMTPPAEVAVMFDKLACRERWVGAGLPMPRCIPEISRYAQLRSTIDDYHCRLFIKLRFGFSAIGAIALEWRGNLVRAITTVETVWSQGRPRLYLSKKPRILHREFEIAWLIDTLGTEQIIVEEWLPKARWNSKPFDLRLVMIEGHAAHVVGRSSNSPFTNLNLDATRIRQDQLEEQFGESWPGLLQLSHEAATLFPRATAFGLDLLVRPGRDRFALLEANAFGDYLPGLLYQGMSTYEAELRSVFSRERCPA